MSMLLGQLRPVVRRAVGAAAPRVARAIGGAITTGRGARGLVVLKKTKRGTPVIVAIGNRIVNLGRRRRGISATELRGFRKVTGLLRRVGMRPAGLGGHRAALRPRRRRRLGDPERLPDDDDDFLEELD